MRAHFKRKFTRRVRSSKVLEQDIVNDIMQYLRIEGIYCWRQNTSGIYIAKTNSYRPSRARGVSDILGICKNGRILAIEVKKPGSKLTCPYQILFKDNVIASKGLYILAYSVADVAAEISVIKGEAIK